jgi:hypothetical protein
MPELLRNCFPDYEATVIELRPGEKRINIDFRLPIEDVLKPLGHATSNR